MRNILKRFCTLGAVLAFPLAAVAQEPVKIGLVTTLSGPTGYLGEEVRDSFLLAVEQEGGKLGGVPVKLIIEDDANKPGNAKQIVDRLLDDEQVKIITGLALTNILLAAAPDVMRNGATYVSTSPGPSLYAGNGCQKGFFSASWQNDVPSETAGAIANTLGYKRVMIFAANYQAGKEAVAGFKRQYKGAVIAETYVKLDQMDFAVELAQIRETKPDAVFEFFPGGLGITFLKQYEQAGLKGTVPVLAGAIDDHVVEAVGNAALGVHTGAHWNFDLKNPPTERFVAEFERKYHRRPTLYAAQAYDAAQLIGSGLKATHGNVADQDAFRSALEKADFKSLRGSFVFAQNHYPVLDWYDVSATAGPDGKVALTLGQKVLTNHKDSYVAECKM